MVVWRLSRERHADLSGMGGLAQPGRCHAGGHLVVYATEHLALAVLEIRVRTKEAPADFVAMEIELPDDSIATLAELPFDWRDRIDWSRAAGEAWLRSKSSVALAVPSAVVLGCTNYLLNPLHQRFGAVTIKRKQRFDFDVRLFQ